MIRQNNGLRPGIHRQQRIFHRHDVLRDQRQARHVLQGPVALPRGVRVTRIHGADVVASGAVAEKFWPSIEVL